MHRCFPLLDGFTPTSGFEDTPLSKWATQLKTPGEYSSWVKIEVSSAGFHDSPFLVEGQLVGRVVNALLQADI